MAAANILTPADISWVDDTIDAINDPAEADVLSDGASFNSDVTSLTSTAFDYTYENGRRYHSFRAGKYALPNDEREQERLDMMHHVWLLLTNGALVLAPISQKKGARFLDLGTGTGIFAIELADEYSNAHIIGTDLSPIQPGWVPPNCSFEVDDFDENWTWPENHFDFIHTRTLMGSVKDWPALLKKAYKHLAPGGWLELKEFDVNMFSDDGSVKPDSAGKKYFNTLIEAATKAGQKMDDTARLAGRVKDAGFVDIQEKNYKVPCGTWPKDKRYREIGMWTKEISQTGAEAYGLALFTRVLGMNEEDAKKLCNGYVQDLENKSIHGLGYWKIIYARKPEC